jgi:hypothetical protein
MEKRKKKQVGKKCVGTPGGTPGTNGRADKNGHFRVRLTTQTDVHAQFKRPKWRRPIGDALR